MHGADTGIFPLCDVHAQKIEVSQPSQTWSSETRDTQLLTSSSACCVHQVLPQSRTWPGSCSPPEVHICWPPRTESQEAKCHSQLCLSSASPSGDFRVDEEKVTLHVKAHRNCLCSAHHLCPSSSVGFRREQHERVNSQEVLQQQLTWQGAGALICRSGTG